MANDVTSLTAIITSDLTGYAVTSAQILTEIQASIKDYEGQRFYFNERSLSVTLSSTVTYALSLFAAAAGSSTVSDIVEVDNITATVNSTTYLMDEITYEEYQQLASNTTLSGYPYKWAPFAQSVFIYPKPNGTYTATMAAHVRFTEVASGSDTNAWLTEGRELIRRSALKRLYGTLIKDAEQAQIQATAESQALVSLMRRADALSGHRVRGYL